MFTCEGAPPVLPSKVTLNDTRAGGVEVRVQTVTATWYLLTIQADGTVQLHGGIEDDPAIQTTKDGYVKVVKD